MSGSEWGALGVLITFVGALCAWYGTRLSGQEAKARVEAQLALTQQVALSNRQLAEKADEVAEAQRQLRLQSDELAAKSQEIAALNLRIAEVTERSLAYVLGSGSFFYLHVHHFGDPTLEVRLRHVGENPVRDSEIIVWDVSNQIGVLSTVPTWGARVKSLVPRKARVPATYPGQENRLTGDLILPDFSKDSHAYVVWITGANGTFIQRLQFVKVSGVWRQAYAVGRWVQDKEPEPYGVYIEEGFPSEGEVLVRPAPGFRTLR